MDALLTEGLVRLRPFPPVVHSAHARDLLTGLDPEALAGWTAGYAITVPEHRRLVEDLLSALCRQRTGQAALLNGLYGTGKSHLLVLLHLLLAHPPSWEPFLEAHPAFRRYRDPLRKGRMLVVHFSLDAYPPKLPLEEVILREVAQAMPGMEKAETPSRLDVWAAIMACCRTQGYDGLVLLADELSLFLSGKTPAKREEDAAFLQFLAGWTSRAPLWFIAAMQRTLSDVGPLRAHSWRQVEDRFRRYTLCPQQIGDVLRDKLLLRTDPAAVRALVAERILPLAAEHGLSAGELQANWPFHPHAIDLITAVVNGHLSPHRSVVELFQRIGETDVLRRPPQRLITPLDLLTLLTDDLRNYARPAQLWRAVELLYGCVDAAPDPSLARQLIDLLLLLHLAERPLPVSRVRALLFDGVSAPTVDDISRTLHALRRQGAYLAVSRDADPAAEVFLLAIDDEVGALARGYMLEMRQEMAGDDPRVAEVALQACLDPAWPLNPGPHGLRVPVPWCGGERGTLVSSTPSLSPEEVARGFEGLLAAQSDGRILLLQPGTDGLESWRRATATFSGPYAGTYLLWQPRPATAAERDLWLEYAAWERAAHAPVHPTGARERKARQRCRERAEELRPAVETSLRRLYQEGRWGDARGNDGTPGEGSTLTEILAGLFDAGFTGLFPLASQFTAGGLPSRAAAQQLLAQLVDPGEVALPPQSLLGDYIERFMLPLGCAEIDGLQARVTPPRWELLEPLLGSLAEPLRLADAVAILQRPPLGLTPEQARLVILTAVKTGATQGLDGFLQPLDLTTVSLSRSDTLAFVGAPPVVDERFRSLALTLAERWSLPTAPWPVACSQLERRLRAMLPPWAGQLPEIRAALAEWSALLPVLPWQWKETDGALARLEHAVALCRAPFTELLAFLTEDDAHWLSTLADTLDALHWWQDNRQRLHVLLNRPSGERTRQGVEALRERLLCGEACFPALNEMSGHVAAAWEAYREEYHAWHDTLFGPQVVTALRQAFDLPEFRAVKALSRLPLPPPDAAASCLNALAQARAGYCPGIFTGWEADGLCAKCRLPFGSPSPLPDSTAICRWADEALEGYARLLAEHPWADIVRARLPRAPEGTAGKARAFLDWHAEDGARSLLDLLDDPLLVWLCRDQPAAGVRRVEHLQRQLAGRDLTVEETRHALQRWLDPEQSLSDAAVLTFE